MMIVKLKYIINPLLKINEIDRWSANHAMSTRSIHHYPEIR